MGLLVFLCTHAALACSQPSADKRGDEALAAERARMVEWQIAGRGVRDERVLDAMRSVPRHRFVPASYAAEAYADGPLPIGHGQTISQPYIVALMTELVRPAPGDRVLEIGTGSGYQAAVLAPLVKHVFTIEIVDELAREATARLQSLGIHNVTVRSGDGYGGWPEEAPFDIIVVTAAPDKVPPALLDQLGPDGRLVIPVGRQFAVQTLQLMEKTPGGRVHTRSVAPVRFVPLQRAEPR